MAVSLTFAAVLFLGGLAAFVVVFVKVIRFSSATGATCFGRDPEDGLSGAMELPGLSDPSQGPLAPSKTKRILLLGAGESGKSTVLKQLRWMYKMEVDDETLAMHSKSLRSTTAMCMMTLLDAARKLGVAIRAPAAQQAADRLREFFDIGSSDLPAALADDIETLWADADVQKVFARRHEYWILDAAPYYFEHAQRFASDDFVPTEEDILMSRVRTTGIVETKFDDAQDDTRYVVLDVGGQRNERRKWLHCFDKCDAIVFVVSLAGYDQRMFENVAKVRMSEAIEVFKQIADNRDLADVPLFLVLNKKDLFEDMLRERPLSVLFDDYAGNSTADAISFVEKQFASSTQRRVVTGEPVSARVKKDIKVLWEEVRALTKKKK